MCFFTYGYCCFSFQISIIKQNKTYFIGISRDFHILFNFFRDFSEYCNFKAIFREVFIRSIKFYAIFLYIATFKLSVKFIMVKQNIQKHIRMEKLFCRSTIELINQFLFKFLTLVITLIKFVRPRSRLPKHFFIGPPLKK